MNVRKLQMVNEFLTEQMNHWMLFPVVMSLSGITMQASPGHGLMLLLIWEFCSMLPLIFFRLRMRAGSAAVFLLLHIPAGVLFALAASAACRLADYPGFMCNVIFVGTSVGYVIYSSVLYLKNGERYTGAMPLPVAVGIAVVARAMEIGTVRSETLARSWSGYYYFPLVLCMGLFFVIMYIRRYIDFLDVNKSSAGYLPASDMFHSGLGLVLGYTVFGVAVMGLIAAAPWMKSFGEVLGSLLMRFVKWLASLVFRGGEDSEDLLETERPGELPPLQEWQGKGPFWLWEVLQYVALAAVLILLAFLLVRVVIWLVAFLQRFMLSRMRRVEVDEEEAFDVRERCDIGDRPGRKRQKLFGPFSYGERIRRLFKVKVLFAGKGGSAREAVKPSFADRSRPEYYTAREWEKELNAPGMAAIYEKARYSRYEATAEDLKRMREACRQGSL